MKDKNYISIFHNQSDSKLMDWHHPYSELAKIYQPCLDFGCGNGMFIAEFMKLGGETIVGMDSDKLLISGLKDQHIDAKVGNVESLKEIETESFKCVHCSHVVEHMWGDELVDFISESSRILVDKGILILRTPNWTNENVNSGGFWDDYTHKRPYSLNCLQILCENYGLFPTAKGYEPFGWEDSYIILQKANNPEPISLNWVLKREPQNKLTLRKRIKNSIKALIE